MRNEQELMSKLGFQKDISRNDIKSISMVDLEEKIKKLQTMTNREFSQVLKQPIDKVADFKITIDEFDKSCSIVSECRYAVIQFEVLFQYDINGFEMHSKANNIRIPLKSRDMNQYYSFLSASTLQRKNAGYFLLRSEYNHHSTYCGNSYQSSAIDRSIFSLLIPNYEQMTELFDFSDEDMYNFLNQQIFKNIPNMEITIEVHKEAEKQLGSQECFLSHNDDDDICNPENCDYSDCEMAHSESEYCDRNCSKSRALEMFYTHPHFFVEMNNFCTGDQFDSNIKMRELQEYPNPISYLSTVINIASEVYYGDAYKKNEYFMDVFANWHIFAKEQEEEFRSFYVSILHGKQSDRPTADHILCNNCYCWDCVQFKRLLSQGLKFDPSKLKITEFEEKDTDWLHELLMGEYSNKKQNVYNKIKKTVEEIDLLDEKYHISDKSKLNQIDSIMEHSHSRIGFAKSIEQETGVMLNLSDSSEQFKPIFDAMKILEDETNYTTVTDNFISELKEFIGEKLSNEKINAMITEYAKNMLY